MIPLMSASAVEHFDIASWRTASSGSFGQLDVDTEDPATFHATLRSTKVGDISLFDMHTSPHTVNRYKIAANEAPFVSSACKSPGPQP